MKDVFILVTMDCERAKTEVPKSPTLRDWEPAAPADYRVSERSIVGYWETAQSHGFPVTFFVHPEVAQVHSALFLDLQRRGACVGLHLHPWKFGNGQYANDLGAFSENEQLSLLQNAMAIWEDALGQRPQYFRPGSFSANDSTFRVLAALGFRGGQISCPGRIRPRSHVVWAGAELDPHRAHPNFRQVPGDLPLVNVPFSVDLQWPVQRETFFHYQDLQTDRDIDHVRVLRSIATRLGSEAPKYPTITNVTHNDHDFSNPSHPWRIRLERFLTAVHPVCEGNGLCVVPSTVGQVCEAVLDEVTESGDKGV